MSNQLLNYELRADGVMELRIPAYFLGSQPVLIDRDEADKFAVFVGTGAKVQFREFGSIKTAGFELELYLDQQAEVSYSADEVCLGELGFLPVTKRVAKLETGSRIDWYGATLGSSFKSETVTNLVGVGASSDYHWLAFASRDEQLNLLIGNCFAAKDCRGQIWIRGAAELKSQLEICGSIEITLAGTGTDSYLKEDTLLLDKTAKIRALPCLEIKTNDVKAGHGATVTNLDSEDLFYLESRGVNKDAARKLIIEGFLNGALANCQDLMLVEKVQELTMVKI